MHVRFFVFLRRFPRPVNGSGVTHTGSFSVVSCVVSLFRRLSFRDSSALSCPLVDSSVSSPSPDGHGSRVPPEFLRPVTAACSLLMLTDFLDGGSKGRD